MGLWLFFTLTNVVLTIFYVTKRTSMKNEMIFKAGTVLALTFAMAGCGSDGDSGGAVTPPVATSSFTQTATWAVALPATGSSACYDIDTRATADCAGTDWDLKLKSGGRTATLWTNGGTSAALASNKGGTLGSPFNYLWADLQTWTSASRAPGETVDIPSVAWLADGLKNVFSGTNSIGTAAFEYGVDGSHKLFPTFRTFLISTDGSKAHTNSDNVDGVDVFSLQMTGYYGGASGTTAGYVSFRFAEKDMASTFGAVNVVSNLNASTSWVYYDLVNNTVVDVPSTTNWHVAFNRYSIKLNQGDATTGTGPGTGGKVAGFLGKTPAGFYEADGTTPVVTMFTSATAATDTLPGLTANDLALPATASRWIKDAFSSPLNPDYRIVSGSPAPPASNMVADYGWFTYYMGATEAAAAGLGAAHMLKAKPEVGAMLRSASGNSYARFHLQSIAYAVSTDYNSQQTWTFEFNIQPTP
jgi:hypothetical protein